MIPVILSHLSSLPLRRAVIFSPFFYCYRNLDSWLSKTHSRDTKDENSSVSLYSPIPPQSIRQTKPVAGEHCKHLTMSFSGAAFEKNFTVTARPAAEASTQRTVSIKDRLGPTGGGFSAGAVNEPRTIGVRGGGAPRGGPRYSDHDDRARMPYNDYDRPDRGAYR